MAARPYGDAQEVIDATEESVHHIHVWIVLLDIGQEGQIKQTCNGLDELMLAGLRPWKDMDTNSVLRYSSG